MKTLIEISLWFFLFALVACGPEETIAPATAPGIEGNWTLTVKNVTASFEIVKFENEYAVNVGGHYTIGESTDMIMRKTPVIRPYPWQIDSLRLANSDGEDLVLIDGEVSIDYTEIKFRYYAYHDMGKYEGPIKADVILRRDNN